MKTTTFNYEAPAVEIISLAQETIVCTSPMEATIDELGEESNYDLF